MNMNHGAAAARAAQGEYRKLTYEEAVDYIGRIPKYTEKHTVEDTRRYLDALGAPDEGMKIIHAAGTNGKGSVCCYLSTILQESGLKTALFVSPHLVSIRERISVDGKQISKDDFAGCFNRVLTVTKSDPERFPHPTFFEFLFFMAMLWFREQAPDAVVLETGLGGRLDATNIVREKVLTVITRIGMDHMQYLGNTIAAIAAEKAGILRAGTPAVVPEEPGEALRVFRGTAEELHAPLTVVDNRRFSEWDGTAGEYRSDSFSCRCAAGEGIEFSAGSRYDKIKCTLKTAALYQPENCALAVYSAETLKEVWPAVTDETIRRGVGRAFWEGRMEFVPPDLYLDGGHNADGINAFLRSVKGMPKGKGRKFLLFSAVRDKQYEDMVHAIESSGLFALIAAAPMETARSLSEEELQDVLRRENRREGDSAPETAVLPDISAAFQLLRDRKKDGDLIFAAGSLYLVGQLKSEWISEESPC